MGGPGPELGKHAYVINERSLTPAECPNCFHPGMDRLPFMWARSKHQKISGRIFLRRILEKFNIINDRITFPTNRINYWKIQYWKLIMNYGKLMLNVCNNKHHSGTANE